MGNRGPLPASVPFEQLVQLPGQLTIEEAIEEISKEDPYYDGANGPGWGLSDEVLGEQIAEEDAA